MKVAVIGAGLSGLGLAYHLLKRGGAQVVVFDEKGIGGGASSVASGLMHPYVGEQGRRSQRATEGMAATRELLEAAEKKLGVPVARADGIIRITQNDAQRAAFEAHVIEHGDVESLGGGKFLIRSGITVHCSLYLHGLWKLIEGLGGKHVQRKVEALPELSDFDEVVIAAGAGVFQFPECKDLNLQYTRGQVLCARQKEGGDYLSHSLIGKGYVALGESPGLYHLGSTYEKGVFSDVPSLETGKEQILPKIATFYPEGKDLEILGCRAGIRVAPRGHYFPLTLQLAKGCWILTGMGSRGLLYHALIAQTLVSNLVR